MRKHLLFVALSFIIMVSGCTSATATSLNIDGHGIHIKSLSDDLTKDNAFEFSHNGTNVSFVPKSIYLQSDPQNSTKGVISVSAQITGNEFLMKEMFGVNTSYKLTQMNGYVKEELILLSNPYPSATDSDTFVFKHRFNYSGLMPYINGIAWDESGKSTMGEILFKNGNEIEFKFLEPYAVDGKGARISLIYSISKNKQTGEMNIKLNVPTSFLNSATYPVLIDPSLEQSGGTIELYGTQIYDYVNIINGAVVNVAAYNGTNTTGWIIFNVTQNFTLDSTSSINGTGKGYRGGERGLSLCVTVAQGGELKNYGGGDNGTLCGGAGGGSYGTYGGKGGNSGSGHAGGNNGTLNGTTSDWDINMGNGAGAGGGGGSVGSDGYNGSSGGGMLTINAKYININGTVVMNGSKGGNGGSTGSSNGGGGGGGASGGGVLLNATSIINISNAKIFLNGGSGGNGGGAGVGYTPGSAGGSGGNGRFKVFYRGGFLNTSTTVLSGTEYYLQVNSVPSIPVTIQENNYHALDLISINWTNSTDDDGDNLVYDLKVWNITTNTIVLDRVGIINTSQNTFIPQNWTNYNYSARAYDGNGYSSWSGNKTFGFTNSKINYTNVTLSPAEPSDSNDLSVTFNASDLDGDGMINYTLWYKNNVLQTTLNNTMTVLASNTSNGEIWRVDVFGNDSYENSTAISSNEVIIGSTNSAPTFTSLVISPSSGTLGTTITINASGISDDSTQWRAQTYYLSAEGNKVYLGNSSWGSSSYILYTVTSPWSDSSTRTLYTVIYDNGDGAGQNLTSSPLTAYFTSQVTVAGGGGGGGGAAPTPIPGVTAKPPPMINLPALAKDTVGNMILQFMVIVGLVMVLYGLFYKQAKLGTLVTGMIVFGISIWALGWIVL